MKILVCVKQVPGSNNVEVDPVTGVLKRNNFLNCCSRRIAGLSRQYHRHSRGYLLHRCLMDSLCKQQKSSHKFP